MGTLPAIAWKYMASLNPWYSTVFSQLCYPLNCWYIVPGSTWELSQEKRLVALSTMVKRWVWPPLEAGRGPTRSTWTWERVATFGLLQPEAVSSSEPLLCFCQGVVGREERHLALWLSVGRLSVLPADGSQATDLCLGVRPVDGQADKQPGRRPGLHRRVQAWTNI